MVEKDFLSQFSNENKPDSFKEEERIKITKQRNPFNTRLLIVILLIVLLVGGALAFVFLRPTIEVDNFVGKSANDVKAWIRQNEIETQGVIFKEEYNFDYDEGFIISQSIESGKKIKKKTKMDFVVSLGADPEEHVKFVDIKSMNKDELQDWIKDNKLTKTKITTQYSDDVEINEVISYELKNVDEDEFKRSSTLNIYVSKGPQPAGVVTVPDFEKKLYTEVETWAKTNKIELKKVTSYSDKIDKDCVISQSVEAKKEMKESETLTVYVSLGKGIKVPDFSTMDNDEVDEWIEDNKAYCSINKMYSYETAYVLSQSYKSGSTIGEDDKLKLTLNLGNHFYLDEVGLTASSFTSYEKCKEYAEGLIDKGITIDTHRNYVSSKEPRNKILSINKIYSGNEVYSELQKLPLEVEITYNISNGYFYFPYQEFINNKTVKELKKWASDNSGYGITLDYNCDENDPISSLRYAPGEDIDESMPNMYYLEYGVKIIINK